MKFGDNLKNLRKMKNISQEELADKIGVSRQSVSKWECGDAYPTMENILLLCEIFHCKMNDLVHETWEDFEFLDEEVKKNVMKLSKEKQKQMKGLSKTVYIISRVMKAICSLSILLLSIFVIAFPFVASNVTWSEDRTITFYNEKIEYEVKEKEIILKDRKGEYTLTDFNEVYPLMVIIDVLENHSVTKLLVFTELAFAILISTLVFLYLTFWHLEKLFVNFHNGETPFTLENISHMKKMALFMVITIIVPSIVGSVCEFVFDLNLNIGFDLIDFVYILFLYSLTYIFEYGYEIQRDSKGKIYANE